MLLPQGVDVCDDSHISQMQKCVVYDGAVNHRGVEEGQLRIAWSIPIEIGMREGSSM